MMRDLCFWSIGDGQYAKMMQTLVRSYRAVGMEEDFHAFADRPVEGAISHPLPRIDKAHYMFKFELLRSHVASLEYRHFAFLDADNFFVRRPRDPLALLQGAPLHSFLESDCTDPAATRPDWWGCPLPRFVSLMRERGVTSPRVYNVNAGFWIVHRDAVETVCRLVREFWEHSRRAGFTFTEEAPLAYATHMLCVDPDLHLMKRHFDVWSCDWTGAYADRLPDGDAWTFRDYLTSETHQVNPAIVHAMRSKEAMIRASGMPDGPPPRPAATARAQAAPSLWIPRVTAPVKAPPRPPPHPNALSERTARAEMDRFIQRIPDCPGGFEGDGIVIPTGGWKYLPSAWVTANMLRRNGCELPIQFWHLGPEEMPDGVPELVRPLGVECVDARLLTARHPARILNGWELKAYAILHSPFRRVVLLDADNVPLIDPAALFETEEFQRRHAIFWPDIGRLPAHHVVWGLTGVAYRDEPEIESGQICVDKVHCWRELSLAMWMNEHSDFWYSRFHGDKETFHLAFRKLGRDYAMPSTPPAFITKLVLGQHDFAGRIIFQHRVHAKWRIDGHNPKIAGFAEEDACFEYLARLVAWIRERDRGGGERRRARIVTQRWRYERVGHDQRPMSFLGDGRVGEGSARCERFWRLSNGGRELTLYDDDQRLTCRLAFEPAIGAWTGSWEVHERMPIRLTPISS